MRILRAVGPIVRACRACRSTGRPAFCIGLAFIVFVGIFRSFFVEGSWSCFEIFVCEFGESRVFHQHSEDVDGSIYSDYSGCEKTQSVQLLADPKIDQIAGHRGTFNVSATCITYTHFT